MEQMTLFDNREETIPLASRLRPQKLEYFIGQEHLLGQGKMLKQLIEKDQISSTIFWGPPGAGYQYAHNTEEKLTNMECQPESMKGSRYYFPTSQGDEAKVKERLDEIMEWKRENKG